MSSPDTSSGGRTERQRWMAVLARASAAELDAAWEKVEPKPRYRPLRRPEAGMVMVRGRAGGTGGRFNLGEITVTRCAVQLDDGPTGHAYVAGRSARHAELAAVFDAMLQDPARAAGVAGTVIAPLAAAQAERRRRASMKAASTRVEFFTVVRGENE